MTAAGPICEAAVSDLPAGQLTEMAAPAADALESQRVELCWVVLIECAVLGEAA